MLECLSNKVACLKACNCTKKRLQHNCFRMRFPKFLRAPILKNIWERLLLLLQQFQSPVSSKLKTVSSQLFHDGDRYYVETGPLIYSANQWTGFYMIMASVMKELTWNIFQTLFLCLRRRLSTGTCLMWLFASFICFNIQWKEKVTLRERSWSIASHKFFHY